MDRGAWRATVHGVEKESDMTEVTEHACQIQVLPIYPLHYSSLLILVSAKSRAWDVSGILPLPRA